MDGGKAGRSDPRALYLRTDWALMRIFTVPTLVVAPLLLFPKLKLVHLLRLFGGRGGGKLMVLTGLGVAGLFHRSEELWRDKPFLALDHAGLVHEEGGGPETINYEEISGLLLRRHGDLETSEQLRRWFAAPYWLEIQYLDKKGEAQVIEVRPSKVEGGLLRLRRFARALGAQLDALPRPETARPETEGTGAVAGS